MALYSHIRFYILQLNLSEFVLVEEM